MSDRRHSKKREAILELIQSTEEHPTARWVYERLKPRLPGLSLGTVYRNIKVLLDEGVLASAGVVHGEERFDGDAFPHPHAVCKRCGLIIDLPGKEKAEVRACFPAGIPGFAVDIRNTVFYGICENGICKETAALGR